MGGGGGQGYIGNHLLCLKNASPLRKREGDKKEREEGEKKMKGKTERKKKKKRGGKKKGRKEGVGEKDGVKKKRNGW